MATLAYNRVWHLIDAKHQILGKLATQIAVCLMGKTKPIFHRGADTGDYVVVINSNSFRLTGNKMKYKTYVRHSGYPGGFKQYNIKYKMEKDPAFVIKHAVKGMLPRNDLRSYRLDRLFCFEGEDHPYADRIVRDYRKYYLEKLIEEQKTRRQK
ncbi:50S ribosomal protein L13 [Rozella allomycis CSF55]|uniref:50S ribosomal protein L13 n=1 Tax=Rozella allomycis (strain CSF55) TaxID=988480 RepID=A0A4P9YAC1_ROZAC|nr:50S ribosomal protein L13 [Rozella allomycis CSF55]